MAIEHCPEEAQQKSTPDHIKFLNVTKRKVKAARGPTVSFPIHVKWNERLRMRRWAIIGAFAGMIPAAWAVFELAYFGSTFDRYLIMVAGLLGGGGRGALLASLAAPRNV